jgi:hypothetical protein
VLRDERELLTDLMRVCNQAPDFALEFMTGTMPIEAEEAFAHRLVDVAEVIMRHVKERRRLVIDGQTLAIEPDLAPFELE